VTARQIAVRLMQAVLTVWIVTTLTFVLLHAAPGDPFSSVAEETRVSPQVAARMRHEYALDRPLAVQYGAYLNALAHGYLGPSLSEHRTAGATLAEALPNSIILGVAALVVNFGLGLCLGVYQGSRIGSRSDRAISVTTLTFFAVPAFWLAHLFILMFVERLHWLPGGGMMDDAVYQSLSAAGRLLDRARHLTLPALTLGLVGAAATARYQRSAMRDAMTQPYIRVARAKGLGSRAVLWRHALRNALVPAIALLGLELPTLLSGFVVIESVFGWPGLGRVTAGAIFRRDYFVVTGAAILTAAIVSLGSLAADVLQHAADPRLRSNA
jgi:peptide/nickel transport system permease protein